MKPIARLFTVWLVLALAGPAIAENSELDVPAECMPLVPETTTSPMFWDQWMSLAACMQDGSVVTITKVADVEPMVTALMVSITPSIMLYREVLEHAPGPVKLRAAFHVGVIAVAMMTRARIAIHRDPKLARELEPLLEPARDMARVAFVAVIEEAAAHAELRVDPVNQYMVRAAREHLKALGPEKAPVQTVRALR